ncbi:MAG TPA: DUF3108 domain-containing protein [Terriglobales bacterium]|nr:DUF3108 domain-containing protein [Terriglobales bacterium]
MRFRLLVSVLVLSLTGPLGAQRQGPGQARSSPSTQSSAPPATAVIGPVSMIHPPPPDHPFPNGETYTYSAEWRIWTAGTVTLGITNFGGRQKVNGSADSAGVVSALYPVRDRFEAVFSPGTFCSQSLKKHIEEGFHSHDTLITYDYQRRKSVLDETNLKTKERKRAENEIPACVTDVLSGLYYLAAQPLLPGASYHFPINDGGQTVEVEAKVEAKETVKVPAGTYNTIRVSPEVVSGPLSKRGKIWIWYSDDSRRIPVQMRGRMFWGTLTFQLLRIEKK